jgi:hypothetical protein
MLAQDLHDSQNPIRSVSAVTGLQRYRNIRGHAISGESPGTGAGGSGITGKAGNSVAFVFPCGPINEMSGLVHRVPEKQ